MPDLVYLEISFQYRPVAKLRLTLCGGSYLPLRQRHVIAHIQVGAHNRFELDFVGRQPSRLPYQVGKDNRLRRGLRSAVSNIELIISEIYIYAWVVAAHDVTTYFFYVLSELHHVFVEARFILA